MRNVEIKAQVTDLTKLTKIASTLSESSGELIEQEDTFFNAPNGRLKLRKIQGKPAQLIYYDRPDVDGPKLSDYHITIVENHDDLKETLRLALGIHGEVKKTRQLFMVGQTRVHVDQVEGLGDYMELEVVLSDEETVEHGQKIADELMEKLGVVKDDLIVGAYMDLLNKASKRLKTE